MGHRILWKAYFSYLASILLSFPLNASEEAPAKEAKAPELRSMIESAEWSQVLDSLKETKKPIEQLLKLRANFELENWKEITESPRITDKRFSAYDSFLRIFAHFNLDEYEKVVSEPVPDKLPSALKQRLYFLQAQAHLQNERLNEAKLVLRQFLEDFPYSQFKSKATLQLADIEWQLENQYEALHLYETIYTFYPLRDPEDVAAEKLREAGRLYTLETDKHLERIQRLRRAALFTKAIKELKNLNNKLSETERERIELAVAGMEFARKAYPKVERTAKAALKQDDLTEKIRQSWQSLYAFSLTRQGKYDRAIDEYDKLIKNNPESPEVEPALLRLGLIALDEQNWRAAAENFQRLREKFPRGNYQESSHWFEAWSLYQKNHERHSKKKEVNKEELEHALSLLQRLPDLPEGAGLAAQALYWRAEIQSLLGNKKDHKKLRKQLDENWAASFHALLAEEEEFGFLRFDKALASQKIVEPPAKNYRIPDPAFQLLEWKRLEAFVQAGLETWAQMELDSFLNHTGQKNRGLRKAVAIRLQELRDWSNLIHYAQIHFPFSIERLDPEDKTARLHYPQAYYEYVIPASQEFQVSPFLVWGVMREESRFQADVVSGAGAMGLLQLMPFLGKRIGRKLDDPIQEREQLTDPARNVRYGTYHLKELIDQVSDWGVPEDYQIPLVIASYNAGTSAVRRWLRENPDLPVDEFVERISYSETRAYVKRVLQSANIYYRLYGEKFQSIAKTKEETKL